ncbi:hypothetical protein [Defluviimonas sp. WL0075]|uniref:Uncharacterized protein n=1 Tax=Albidovulum sediminicola TaxID=2984331 RepID=A0ABT2Z069_9RHOB|nr:hypothetical protein [Defluviimonas sp. WL0075]MCV2864512.1 hypothetical protein [Defluviimonas sp. WL0075]
MQSWPTPPQTARPPSIDIGTSVSPMSRGSGAAGHVVICLPDCLSVLMSRPQGVE